MVDEASNDELNLDAFHLRPDCLRIGTSADGSSGASSVTGIMVIVTLLGSH